MSEFRMPSLGADMEAAILMEWAVKPGDKVQRGDVVAVVETQKGVIEIEIFEDGLIERLLVEPGTEVPVGTALALLRSPGEEALPLAPPLPALPPPMEIPAPSLHLRASPAARRRAHELGVSLENLPGSGPSGALTLADVEKLAAPSPPQPVPPAEAMRTAIAAAMSRSKREIPHYYLGHTFDMGPALDWLAETNAERPVAQRLVYAVLLVKAAALALRHFKEFNGYWRDSHFVPVPDIDVGIAISLRSGGLVAPPLCQVDQKGLDVLMAEFLDLVNRARSGQLRAHEIGGGSITVTSLGEQGVETVFPVIYPPQVAMVGFGSLVERPWVVAGSVVPRRLITASLAGDHRVSDGHRGGLFLDRIGKLLQVPEAL